MLHSCSTISPVGDLVDGSPPVAHNATRVKEPGLRPNNMWQGGSLIATCSRSIYQIFIRLPWDTLDMPRKVSPEARDIPRHGS